MEPRELVSGMVRLVSLPEVCLRVNEMLEDPRTSAADIGKVVKQDAGLTARLLKIVNSAYYGFPSRIETVSRAVTIIGMRELRGLVMAASVIEAFAVISTKIVNMAAFWRHSVYCGVVAQLLAERCRVLHSERLFVAGLLHDIGKLIIGHRLPRKAEAAVRLMNEQNLPSFVAEREVLGFDHAEIGGLLLEAWKVPAALQQAVRFHHTPAEAEIVLDACLVHLANIMTATAEEDAERHGAVQAYDPAAWRLSGLDESIIDAVLKDAGPRFVDALELILPRSPHLN